LSMETIEVVFTWGIPLLVIYFLYQSKKELVNINLIFQQLAKDNQGNVDRRHWFEYPSLSVNEQGFIFYFRISLATGGNVWTTRLNMEHRHAIDFELRLQPHSRLEKIAGAIGFQDAAIGSPQFNASFLVKTGNEVKARLFMNEPLQESLLRIKYLNPELAITKSAIVLTTSFTNRTDDFQALVNFGKLLCSQLRIISPA
jgi:hypothetical protein